MEKNTKVKILVFLGLFFVLLGTTYALFSYFNTGNNEISIYSNGISFNYKEGQKALNLENAIPIPDEQGKIQNDYFEFDIKAKSNKKIEIPYYITARKSSSSSNIDEAIKLYLTRIDDNGNEEEVALVKYSELSQYENAGIDLSKYVEKLLYNTEVPVDKNKYHETYRLRMWIDLEANFNEAKYKNATFSIKVNVYALGREAGIEIVKSYIAKANSYYDTVKNNQAVKLGTNVIDRLNLNDTSENDQIVLTKDGKIEAAVVKNGKCYRKSAVSDEIKVVEKDACNVDVTKFPTNNGQLHVCGTHLCSEDGNEVRITGASSSGIGGEDGFTNPVRGEINVNSLNTLRNWGGNAIRVFGIAKINRFASFIGHEDEYIAAYKQLIDAAIASDIYFIACWDPARNNGASFTDEAVDFFTRIANLYPNDPHIIYEIWNEPEDVNTWDQVINHANTVIPAIRNISPDSIIIVGNPNFDGKIDEVKDHPLAYNNLMYTVHGYMGGLNDTKVNKIKTALNDGTPVFVTEWGTMGLKQEDPMVVEGQATSYLALFNKYGISNMQFCFATSTDTDDNRYGIVVRGNWDDDLPDSILKPNGKFLKYSLMNGNGGYKAYVMKGNPSSEDYGDTYRSEDYRDKIVSISFKNNKTAPQNLVTTFDLSLSDDNSIVGYVAETGVANEYKLIIAADGDIYLPTVPSYLFSGMTNLRSIDFKNVKSTYLSSFSGVFRGCTSLESIDLSNIDSTRIDSLWNTFANCTNLKSVDLSSWHAKPTSIGWIFSGCSKLTNVDLSGIDVSSVTEFTGIFYNAKAIKNVNLSYWKPNKSVTSMSQMFRFASALETVDVRNLDITLTTKLENALQGVKAGTKFIVKSEAAGQALQNAATVSITYEVAE